MSKLRSGLNPRAYMGVEATTPPQMVSYNRAPTANDYAEFNVGTLWVDTNVEDIYILTNKKEHTSTWQLFQTGLTPGDVTDVQGGDNINCTNSGGPIVTVNLNKYIDQPVTNAAGTEGIYKLNSIDFMHAYGTQNLFLGEEAGNRSLTVLSSTENTGIGMNALNALTTAGSCVAVGHMALQSNTTGSSNSSVGADSGISITTGWNNSSLGSGSLDQIITGDSNLALGQGSAHSYTGAESSNICISSDGVLGESNTIHIGTEGTGAAQQDTTFIAGIYDAASFPLATTQVVVIDDTGQLAGSAGTDGQIIIGSTAGSPSWTTLGSSDGSVIITNAANSIDLVAVGGGGGGSTTFITDVNSPAVISGSNITMAGGGVLETDGTTANTVTFNLTNGTTGQLLIGGGANAAWANLTSSGGTVTITEGANTINLEAVGSGGGTTTFATDSGSATASSGTVTIAGGLNINTSAASHTVTVNLDNSISLPATNAAGDEGLYSINSLDFMHSYGTGNTFLGESAGNRTLTTGSATNNVAVGTSVLSGTTIGQANTSVGSQSCATLDTASGNSSLGALVFNNLDSGDFNTSAGLSSFYSITSGGHNVGLGYKAGYNHSAADSSNICIGNEGQNGQSNVMRIGTEGTGAGEQDSTYIAGIYDGTSFPLATTQVVVIDDNSQLAGSAGTSGQIMIGSTAGSPAWSTLTAGNEIDITNAANAITIELTNGTDGQLLIGGGTDPEWKNLIAGTNVTIDEAANSITINAIGGSSGGTGTGSDFILWDQPVYQNNTFFYHDIDYDGTYYAACANYGSGARVDYSTDLKNWTTGLNPFLPNTTNQAYGIAYGNGYWVTVGGGRYISVATTPLGAWTLKSSIGTHYYYSVDYGDGYWVAVGQKATGAGTILVATNPLGTWTEILTHPFTATIKRVKYSNGYWVAVGRGGIIAWTVDPIGTWAAVANDFTDYIEDVDYGDGYWAASGGLGQICATSDPATAWTSVATTVPVGSFIRTIAYGNGLWTARYLVLRVGGVLGDSVIYDIHTTNPTAAWKRGAESIWYGERRVKYLNNNWVAVGYSHSIKSGTQAGGNSAVGSSSLIIWRSNKSGPFSNFKINDIAYGNDGYYVGVTIIGDLRTTTAPYEAWPQNTVSIPSIFNGTSNSINAVNYGAGKWVCVGEKYIAPTRYYIIAVATDPTSTWVSIANPIINSAASDVAYGEDGYWVAVTGSAQVVTATNPSGVWSNITTHPFTGPLYTVAYGNGYWVIGGQSGSIAYATNPTGTWSTPTHSITNSFNQIIYANGYWVAVGGQGLLAITDDPSGTWVKIDNPMGDRALLSVTYNNGLWSILSNFGDTMISTDLTTWKYGLHMAETYTGTYYPTVTAYGNNYWVAGGYGGYIWVGTQL